MLKTKTALIFTAISLAVAGGTGLAVLGLSSASAAPGVVYTGVPFTSLNLVTDRQAPSGGKTIAPNLLTENVDNTLANTSGGGFYQTEGLQGSFPVTNSIRGDLFVDPAWAGKQIRAGLWGIAGSTTASDVAWPIIEYTTVGDGSFTGWRVYDTMTGEWTNLTGVSHVSNQWYKLEITFNVLTNNYDYYVNSVFVKSLPAEDGTNVYGNITGVIFNNKNFATDVSTDNYTVKWQNFQTGGFVVTDKAQCKNGGWMSFGSTFKNQGDCVSFVATGGKH